MNDLKDYEWREADKQLWEKSYESGRGGTLYIEDSYLGTLGEKQTTISDWREDRYEVKHKNYLLGRFDETLHSSSDWSEVEAFLEYKAGDYE